MVSPRPAIEIAGLSGAELAADLISLRFVESLTQPGLIAVTLVNWGGSPPAFKYSEASALQAGAQVKLSSGGLLLATGTIASVAPHFNSTVAPTLGFTATVPRPTRAPAPTLALRFGADLLEFNPVLQSPGNACRPAITASGLAGGLPALRAGVSLNIDGLGAHWSGNYAVSEATHSFDAQSGYRVAFACAR
jgi:hypothetical protein